MSPDGRPNGSFAPLMAQIDARLERIERAIDRLHDEHAEQRKEIHSRITVLELHRAENAGSWKTLALIAGGIATVAGLASSYITRLWLGS